MRYTLITLTLIILSSCQQALKECTESDIIVSHESGFYDEPFELTLSTTNEDCTILYTLDGSDPSVDNLKGTPYNVKMEYDKPLKSRWQKTKEYIKQLWNRDIHNRPPFREAIKQIAKKDKEFETFYKQTLRYKKPITLTPELTPSIYNITTSVRYFEPPIQSPPKIITLKVKSHGIDSLYQFNYLIGDAVKELNSHPIVSISMDPEDLFGYEKGIHVPGASYSNDSLNAMYYSGNHLVRNKESERKAFFSALNLEENKDSKVNLRIQGAGSRHAFNKSFKVIRSKKNSADDLFRKFQLRTGSQDEGSTLFRDVLAAKTMKSSTLLTNLGNPIHLFVNGNYWGIRFFREDFSKKQLRHRFNSKNVHVFKSFENFIESHNLKLDSLPTEVLSSFFDNTSVFDLFISNIVYGNGDFHWKAYVDSNSLKTKYSLVLWDLDFSFGKKHQGYSIHTYSDNFLKLFIKQELIKNHFKNGNFKHLSTLLKSEPHKHFFIQRLATMMSSNLSKTNILYHIDSITEVLEPMIGYHFDRWRTVNNPHYNKEHWYNEIKKMKDFVNERNTHVYQHALDFFDLEGLTEITLNNPHNLSITVMEHPYSVLTHTSRKADHSTWSGTFFKDIPLIIEYPEASTDKRFKGWKINGKLHTNSNKLTFTPSGEEYVIEPWVE